MTVRVTRDISANAGVTSLRSAALDYGRRGWAVFPVVPGGKRPITSNGFKDATTDLNQIAAWWRETPDANLAGPVPSTLVVVDVDGAANGFDTLRQLESTFDDLPETMTTLTGGGGMHLWFLHPGGELRQGASVLGPGLDTRTPGRGYLVLPPSVHPSGRRYEWFDPTGMPVMLPNWMANRLRPAPPAPPTAWHQNGDESHRLAGLCKAVATALEGERNALLNWASYRARDLDEDTSSIMSALSEAARAAGLDDREIRQTIASGLGVSV